MTQEEFVRRIAHAADRADAARAYVEAILVFGPPADAGVWHDINVAVLKRWSKGGLEKIKRRAWALLPKPPPKRLGPVMTKET